ncbi:hypothetical protein N7445_009154 [Penicillium cf. griseofulvum]|nr:hypothetical protein N7445_009154 [Penicillium cf. griseofulvum]
MWCLAGNIYGYLSLRQKANNERCQNARIDSISNSDNALMLYKHKRIDKTPHTPPMLQSHALLA